MLTLLLKGILIPFIPRKIIEDGKTQNDIRIPQLTSKITCK